jgi:hypothetical protein
LNGIQGHAGWFLTSLETRRKLSMKLLSTLLLSGAAVLVAAPALAQSAGTPPPRVNPFDQVDLNRDGVITLEEATQARTAAFVRLDANRDGSLSREEMISERRMHGGGPDRPQRRPGRPNPDANGDGTVTRAEWDAAIAARGAEASRSGGEMFARLDANSDGQLVQAELQALRANRAERRGRMEERRGRRQERPERPRMDTNNDGQISRAEWLAVPDRMHERADANRDGRVTREEAENAWRRGERPPAGQR